VTLRDKGVLVTGGAGFIGSHVVDAVVREHSKRVVVVSTRVALGPAPGKGSTPHA